MLNVFLYCFSFQFLSLDFSMNLELTVSATLVATKPWHPLAPISSPASSGPTDRWRCTWLCHECWESELRSSFTLPILVQVLQLIQLSFPRWILSSKISALTSLSASFIMDWCQIFMSPILRVKTNSYQNVYWGYLCLCLNGQKYLTCISVGVGRGRRSWPQLRIFTSRENAQTATLMYSAFLQKSPGLRNHSSFCVDTGV